MVEFRKAPEGGSVQKALADTRKSAFQKYKEIFWGRGNISFAIKFEACQTLISWLPGALGFFLRKTFYPGLFKRVGKGVVFGRNITIRHPKKISIGSNTSIDDNVVLDAKGNSNEGIVIGSNVVVGRNTILSCKEGSIYLGDFANISANCSLLSETSITVGRYSFLAGHCYLVAGGNHSFESLEIPIMFQPSLDKGGITVGDDVWIGASTTILDGVIVGTGCVVGAGALVKDSLPEYSVAVGVPAKIIRNRRGRSENR